MLLPLLMNLGMFGAVDAGGAEVTGRGSWDKLRKQKKRKPQVIRRSDFESIEAYRQAMTALFPVEPKTKIIEPVPPLDDGDDDALILAAVSRLLH